MVGIKDVAAAAEVSVATVSRVLTNQPNVRPAVRERVLEAVKKLNYRPNLVARSLRSQQSNTIGLIVSDIRNPFFTEVSRAIEDAAYEQGFRVLLCNTDENPEKEILYLDLMHDENVAGVIFSPTYQTAAKLKELKLNFPTVIIDRAVRSSQMDMVVLDNVSAAYQLTSHLIDNGYQRVAAIFDSASITATERRQGYEEALAAQHLPITNHLVKIVQHKPGAAYQATLQLLEAGPPPEAIFTGNCRLGAESLAAIKEYNLAIPEKIAFVTFDDTAWASLAQPGITAIAQPTDEIGKTATDLLLQRVADPNRPTRKVVLHGKMLVRGSSGATKVDLVPANT